MRGEYLIGKFNDLQKINPFQEIKQKRGNLIQTKNLKKLCDESTHFLHWVDYLRGVLSNEDMANDLRILPIFDIANDTNSSEITIDWYTPYYLDNNNKKHYVSVWKITVQRVKESSFWEKFLISIPYEDLVVPVIEITFYYWEHNSKIVNSWIYAMIEFKGKPFRLQVATAWAFSPFDFLCGVLLADVEQASNTKVNGNWFVYNALYDTYNLRLAEILAHFKLTRIDYRFDFFLPKGHFGLKDNEVFKNLRSTNANYNSSQYEKKLSHCNYWVKNRYWRHYTGRKNYNKTKYVQARFYQKQVDTWIKWRGDLYPEYMNYNWEVWRLEFQFESKFCNARTTADTRYSFYDEFVERALTSQIFEFVWINEKKGSFCQRYEPISLEFDKQPYTYKRRFFTRYMNDSVKLINNWINPMDLIKKAFNPEQMEKLKSLNSKEKIDNAFVIDI